MSKEYTKEEIAKIGQAARAVRKIVSDLDKKDQRKEYEEAMARLKALTAEG